MDVRQLAYFLAIVDHGGVTRAAAALYISQPSLSQALRGFERSLGVPLFRREGRGLVLTEEGRALVGPARTLLADMAEARTSVDAVVALATGRLDVITDATLAVDPLAEITGRLRVRHPGLRLNVTGPAAGTDVADAVRTGACELGITDLPVRSGTLRAVPLGSQELRLVLPPEPAGPDPVPLSALRDTPLLLPPAGFALRGVIDAAFADAGLEPWVAVECGHLEALANMVIEGAGATFFPAALADAYRMAGVQVRRVQPAPVRTIGIVHRAAPLSPAAQAFLAIAHTVTCDP
ncbi:MAG: LysR family transcriptional regulator [Streptosporangiales bacterium]|nr:LysR family transcriptional regulator [Streptosporangiales bacterium]